jgi:DNA-binding NarL/FixJ family response regulator
VVVLGYDLAHMNGIEATRQIRTLLPETEVLVYTMYNNENFLRSFLAAGARGCVLKSERISTVVEGVRVVAAHKPYFAPAGIQQAIYKLPHALNSPLTNRERTIVQLVATGQTNKKIARSLGISIKTVETHRAAVMRKLTLSSSAQLVRYAVRNGLAVA